MLIFLFLEDAFHGYLNEEYNYHILADILHHLNIFILFKFNIFRIRFRNTFQFIFTIISTFKRITFTSQGNEFIYKYFLRSLYFEFAHNFFIFITEQFVIFIQNTEIK